MTLNLAALPFSSIHFYFLKNTLKLIPTPFEDNLTISPVTIRLSLEAGNVIVIAISCPTENLRTVLINAPLELISEIRAIKALPLVLHAAVGNFFLKRVRSDLLSYFLLRCRSFEYDSTISTTPFGVDKYQTARFTAVIQNGPAASCTTVPAGAGTVRQIVFSRILMIF
jgi:hypothetical protein